MAPSAARSAGCARLLVRLLCASWASLACSLVIVEPLRTAGNLQCLAEMVLPLEESYYNPDEDGCATECASVGPGVCIWFAQTKASESSYLCLFYGSPRTAPTVDCPHNHTLFASDSTYVVWERHEIVSNTSMESPVGCECVCAEVERIGDVSCDETIGALSGCYAHRGVFNEHLLYRQQGQDQSIWMFHSSDTAGKGGWRFDSHPAPGEFHVEICLPLRSGTQLASCLQAISMRGWRALLTRACRWERKHGRFSAMRTTIMRRVRRRVNTVLIRMKLIRRASLSLAKSAPLLHRLNQSPMCRVVLCSMRLSTWLAIMLNR